MCKGIVESMDLWDYTYNQIDRIPYYIYVVVAVVLCIGALTFYVWKGYEKGTRYTALLAMIEYVGLIYSSTVFFRKTSRRLKYDWHPFWSYQTIDEGKGNLISENIMNVVLFIPVGLLLGLAIRNVKWWMAGLIGLCISLGIEALQFILWKGFSEFDDVMHNTVGCLLGFGLIHLVRLVYNKDKKVYE